MEKSFRGAVFSLCNKFKTLEYAKSIQQLLHDMSVSVESPDAGLVNPSHGSFALIARQISKEFLGYLFVDDNIETKIIPDNFKVEHLSKDERALMEMGHRTLTRLVELCLADVTQKSRLLAEIMQPYSLFKPVNIVTEPNPIISDDDLLPVVEAFKSGAIYQTLMAEDIGSLFKRFDINITKVLVGTLEKEIARSMGEDVSNDIRGFSRRIESGYKKVEDALFAYSILIVSIKSSLALACRLLFGSLCGAELFVLNNNNIISIEKNVSTIVGEFYKVFSQDMNMNLASIETEMGNVLLLDCDSSEGTHIHEFGMLVSKTSNLSGEFGQNAKYSFVTVNEELIAIHHLTGQILRIGLPPITVK